MNRLCDALECGATVPAGRFLCPRHWRLVPLATQRAINSRYRACRADFGFLSDTAYLQACVDAIEGIARAEGRAVESTSYHRLLLAAQRCASSAKGA